MPLSKDALERLIEASPDIVVATDARGMVSFYNDGARENLGYSREEIIGRFVAQLYPSVDEAKRVMAAMRDPGGLEFRPGPSLSKQRKRDISGCNGSSRNRRQRLVLFSVFFRLRSGRLPGSVCDALCRLRPLQEMLRSRRTT